MLKKTFNYKTRDPEAVKQRAVSKNFTGDTYLKADFKVLKVDPGLWELRILPPTWPDARHYGYDIWVHWKIGSGQDKNHYLCLQKMKNEPCPICEESLRASQEGDVEGAKKYRPGKQLLMWVIDRKDEKTGPQIFACTSKVDTTLCKLSVNNKTGAVLSIDDPEDGYDITFEKVAAVSAESYPTYEAVNIDRNHSPLHGSAEVATKWLEFVVAHPIPSALIYHTYDHIKKAFEGKKVVLEDEEVSEVTEEPNTFKAEIKEEVKEVLKEKTIVTLASVKTKRDIDSLTVTGARQICVELGFEKEAVDNTQEAELKEAILAELGDKLEKEPPTQEKTIATLKDRLMKLRNKE